MKRPHHHIPPIPINHNIWARTDKQNATAFAEHLASVFQPFPSQLSVMAEETINNDLNAPHKMALPMKEIRINEVKHIYIYNIKLIQKSLRATTWSPEKFLKNFLKKVSEQ
jgi:hypothetical protein